jgi:hypothetical protein
MKKTILILAVAMFATTMLFAQAKKKTAEVLYFKANLACCKAKACNALETDIKTIVEKNYPNGAVVFKQVKLIDEANKPLVDKYSAKSQSVIIVAKTKKKENTADVSNIVQAYVQNQNKAMLEKELVAKINELLKK